MTGYVVRSLRALFQFAFKRYLCSMRRRIPQRTISTPASPPPGCFGIIFEYKMELIEPGSFIS